MLIIHQGNPQEDLDFLECVYRLNEIGEIVFIRQLYKKKIDNNINMCKACVSFPSTYL